MRRRSRLVFLIGLVLGLAVFVVAAPLAVPVEKVRAGVERLLSSYAGQTLRVTGPAVVRLFPGLDIEFRDLEARSIDTGRLALAADRLRVSIDLMQYLLGRGPIASVDLVRPEVHVGLPDAAIADLIDPRRLRSMRPANVSVRGGTVIVVDGDGREVDRLERLTFDYAWPRPAARLRLGASFAWRGQTVTASLQGPGPRTLAGGQAGSASLTLATPLLRVALAGQAVMVDRLQFDGTASLSSAGPLAAARWLAGQATAGIDVGRTALDGRLKLAGGVVTVSGIDLRVGDTHGEGMVSAQIERGRPLVRGTIDFDAVAAARDAVALLPALATLVSTPAIMRRADLDLRLSTERLRLEGIELDQVGATMVVKDGLLTGQIAEARAAGGDITAQLTTQPGGDGTRLALRLTGDRLQLAPLCAALGWSDVRDGTLSGEVRIEALAAPPPALVTALSGRAQFEARAVRVARTPDWLLPPAEAGHGGAWSLDRVLGAGLVAGDTVILQRFIADGPGAGVTLAGAIDLDRGGLRLDGVRALPVAGATRDRAVSRLRLGGTLLAPEARLGD